jgi:glutathione S-transferase
VSGSKIVVYGPSRAPFVEKVLLGLAFKGLFDVEVVAPSGPEDFRRWNPETGMLPVMDFEGTRVPDSGGILDWLDAHLPEPPLVASDPWTARQQRRLETWIGETFYYYWVRWLRSRLLASGGAPEDAAHVGQIPPRGEMARLGLVGRVEALIERGGGPRNLGPEFARRLDDLAGFLGDRPFFYADRPSRADLTAVAFLRSLQSGDVPDGPQLLATRPRLLELTALVRQAVGR